MRHRRRGNGRYEQLGRLLQKWPVAEAHTRRHSFHWALTVARQDATRTTYTAARSAPIGNQEDFRKIGETI